MAARHVWVLEREQIERSVPVTALLVDVGKAHIERGIGKKFTC
jgi:hypothetical protein